MVPLRDTWGEYLVLDASRLGHFLTTYRQWCVAKNGGGYTQRGVAKGLKVPCLFMITEVSIRCQKNPEVGVRRIPAYTPPQYTTAYRVGPKKSAADFKRMCQ